MAGQAMAAGPIADGPRAVRCAHCPLNDERRTLVIRGRRTSMKLTIRHLLTATALLASTGGALGQARADGPGDYGYDPGDPSQANNPEGDQVYQPPPEGVCFDDNNQSYDCSKD